MIYNFPQETRFLITGGAGFIGSNIAKKLINLGYYVRILDNFITGKKDNIESLLKNKNFELIKGDIRDLNTCLEASKDIDYIFHQAALNSVPRSIKNPLLVNEINVNGFLNILKAALKNKIKRVIYASSSNVYGDSLKLPKIEGKEGNVLSPYGATKKINELYAHIFFYIYHLPIIGLRYFNVYGPNQDPHSKYSAVIPIFITKTLKNQPITIYGDGKNSRDFTYVDDVVQANLKACLINNKYLGNVYNVAYGKQTTLKELSKKIDKILNKNTKIIYAPKRKGDIPHSLASIKKIKTELKYEPKFSIDQGLKKTISYYKKRTKN
ncbi:MAG: SDR family oxidoreductase [Bacilli bacterium]|jgi:UDP-N-acetylglucosamine 4-epimerase